MQVTPVDDRSLPRAITYPWEEVRVELALPMCAEPCAECQETPLGICAEHARLIVELL
jgi:hypothetical protein